MNHPSTSPTTGSLPEQTQRGPNVLLIIMDDLAFGDLACHGNPYTRTPNLDRLHRESTRLTRYCSGPVCTPARAALMTGRHPYRTRAIDTWCGRSTIDPSERTLPQVLGEAGYHTGIFGKWHLGDTYPSRAMDMGFKEALVHNGGGLRQPANIGEAGYFDPDLMHNGKIVPSKGYCTDVFTDAALGYITEHRHEPWFTYVGTNAPHCPFEVDERWVQPYRDMGLPETFARVYGMVENIDMNVGRLLDHLDQLKLADDTIVIYTSDHGPCGSALHEGRSRFNAGLRDIKGTMYEGGLRVPCLWRWPGQLPAGRDVDTIANPIDFLPTLAAACHAATPTDRTIDGRNLLPYLQNTGIRPPDRHICMQWHRGDVPIAYRSFAVITQRHKLVRTREDAPDELYDLEEDPGEQHNLADAMPEKVAELVKAYETWFADVSVERGIDTFNPPPIVLGSPAENPVTLTRQDWRVKGHGGWTDTVEGFWFTQIATAGRYDITVTVPPHPERGTLYFEIGNIAREVTIPPNVDRHTFTALSLQAGPARVLASVRGEGHGGGARRVIIRRLDGPAVP